MNTPATATEEKEISEKMEKIESEIPCSLSNEELKKIEETLREIYDLAKDPTGCRHGFDGTVVIDWEVDIKNKEYKIGFVADGVNDFYDDFCQVSFAVYERENGSTGGCVASVIVIDEDEIVDRPDEDDY